MAIEFVRPFKENIAIAAFVYNLTDYVSWPQKPSTIKLCFMNSDDIFKEAERIYKESNYKYNYLLKKIDDMNQISGEACNLLYIDSNNKILLEDLILKLNSKPILTVSGTHNFAKLGGAVEFNFKDGQVSMIINLRHLKPTQLKIDAELLDMVELIR
ncbi:MAG: YfiR family protein [Alphaproteobacteria bacterium]|nr:YfiR family protein [Alphaproteobacteria bacterium]